jgi:hypothetical protein
MQREIGVTQGFLDVLVERERMNKEGEDAHDDGCTHRELAGAAAAYAFAASLGPDYVSGWNELGWTSNSIVANFLWPEQWHIGWFEPGNKDDGNRKSIVRAAAFLLRELDRLDAAGAS